MRECAFESAIRSLSCLAQISHKAVGSRRQVEVDDCSDRAVKSRRNQDEYSKFGQQEKWCVIFREQKCVLEESSYSGIEAVTFTGNDKRWEDGTRMVSKAEGS